MVEQSGQEARIVVVGAGPQALTFCTYLLTACPWWSGRVWVVDPRGWLVSWSEQLARLEIDVLRSTGVHHPDPDPYALLHFAERDPGALVGPYRAPTTGLFERFSRMLVSRLGLEEALVRSRVRSVECSPTGPGRVWLTDGRVLEADHVVMAHNPLQPIVPGWAGSPPNGPCSLGVSHASSIRVAEADAGQRIAVIGGGLTAVQLAVGATRRGSRVTLLSRRPLDVRTADAEPGWLTRRYLASFLAERDALARAGAFWNARRASIPHHWATALQEAKACGHLEVHHSQHVLGLGRRMTGELELHTQHHLHAVDRVWLATGWRLNTGCDPLLAPLVLTGTAGGMPQLDSTLRLPGTPVHVMGGAAGLCVGPFAPNLAGARIAAERIVTHLTGTNFGQYPTPPPTDGDRRSLDIVGTPFRASLN